MHWQWKKYLDGLKFKTMKKKVYKIMNIEIEQD